MSTPTFRGRATVALPFEGGPEWKGIEGKGNALPSPDVIAPVETVKNEATASPAPQFSRLGGETEPPSLALRVSGTAPTASRSSGAGAKNGKKVATSRLEAEREGKTEVTTSLPVMSCALEAALTPGVCNHPTLSKRLPSESRWTVLKRCGAPGVWWDRKRREHICMKHSELQPLEVATFHDPKAAGSDGTTGRKRRHDRQETTKTRTARQNPSEQKRKETQLHDQRQEETTPEPSKQGNPHKRTTGANTVRKKKKKIPKGKKRTGRKGKTSTPGRKVKTSPRRQKVKPSTPGKKELKRLRASRTVAGHLAEAKPLKETKPEKCSRAEPHCRDCTNRPKEKKRNKYDTSDPVVLCRNCGLPLDVLNSGKGGRYHRHQRTPRWSPKPTVPKGWKPCTEK